MFSYNKTERRRIKSARQFGGTAQISCRTNALREQERGSHFVPQSFIKSENIKENKKGKALLLRLVCLGQEEEKYQ